MGELFRENQSVVVGVLVFVVALIAWRVLRPRKAVIGEGMKLNVRCRKCSWQGTVTRYNQVCSKCNGTDLQDLGR